MKKIYWTPILVPFIFAAALAGFAMLVGSLMQKDESSLLDPATTAKASQTR